MTMEYTPLILRIFEQKIVENQAKLFIMCSPHNPVGRVWTAEEVDKIIAICKKHHVFIIADEIHHDLLAEGVHHGADTRQK